MPYGYKRFATRRRAELRMGSQLATTRTGPIEYTVSGSSTGLPVLYFHGGPGGHEQTDLLAPLASLGCRLIGWSRPGYLRTPLEVGRTFPEQADAATALLDELGVARVVAYGLSGGGPPAIEFARRHPTRTTALVLESAISRHYAPRIPALVKMIYLSRHGAWLTSVAAHRWPRTAISDFVRQESSLDSQTRRTTVDWILSDRSKMEYVRAVLGALTPYEDRAPGLENDLEQWATLDDSLTAGVTCPTLVLHGSHDGDAEPSNAYHAAATIPQAELHIVSGGWHLLGLSLNGGTADEARRSFLGLA
ncbi:alpha/beta hydrolase [Actinopolymorpha sp. B9G3]|uniref:alpha/beta fold hydrolase n=1 Tax=Actinopolymorpha sp. B9G3 TaxID=3158970 RepID=UPI0032D93494